MLRTANISFRSVLGFQCVAGTKGERLIPHPIFSTTPPLPINTTQTSQTQNATPVTSQSHNPTQSHPSSTHSSPSHHQLATNISSSSRQQNTTSLASGQTLPIDNTQGEACSSFADLDQPPVYEMSAEGQLTPTSPSSTQNLPTSSAHIEPASSIPSGTSGSVHTSDSLPPSARHTETTQTQPPRRSMRVRRQNPKYFNSHFVNLTTKHDLPSLLEPTSVAQARKSPNWCNAMNEEYQALLRNNTWELVPSQTPIGCKWILDFPRQTKTRWGLSLLLVEIEPGLSPNFSPQRELTCHLSYPTGLKIFYYDY
nr:Reverse transcriptase, RNA-dependent DNA polymerase [Ipomoea batatas]